MKDHIFLNLIKIMQAGYEIRMTNNSFTIIEIYKSQSREKWHEIKVFDSFGSFEYWTDNTLHIIDNKLSEFVKELCDEKK